MWGGVLFFFFAKPDPTHVPVPGQVLHCRVTNSSRGKECTLVGQFWCGVGGMVWCGVVWCGWRGMGVWMHRPDHWLPYIPTHTLQVGTDGTDLTDLT